MITITITIIITITQKVESPLFYFSPRTSIWEKTKLETTPPPSSFLLCSDRGQSQIIMSPRSHARAQRSLPHPNPSSIHPSACRDHWQNLRPPTTTTLSLLKCSQRWPRDASFPPQLSIGLPKSDEVTTPKKTGGCTTLDAS